MHQYNSCTHTPPFPLPPPSNAHTPQPRRLIHNPPTHPGKTRQDHPPHTPTISTHTHDPTNPITHTQARGIPHHLAIDAPDAKLPGEDRIEFLVRMRNKALAPMFDDDAGLSRCV